MNPIKSVAPILLVIFAIFWLLLAINPIYRNIWIAENIILVICLYYLVIKYQKFHFSNLAYYLIFIFCILQTIGAHYTYAEVPAGFWVSDLLGLERNHYDRFVHFAFGFLIVQPFKEVLTRFVHFANRNTEIFILVMIFFGIGACYEIVEWWYAALFETGVDNNAFLGSQGDIWDAEKDVLLSGIGAYLYLKLFGKIKV